jgi:hypothetical protein
VRLRALVVTGFVVVVALAFLLALSGTVLAADAATITAPEGSIGLPKAMLATPGRILWDQPAAAEFSSALISGEGGWTTQYPADDFVSADPWVLRSIYVPCVAHNSLFDAVSFTWQIYADDGGVPDGSPTGFGNDPVWSLTLPPSSPLVTVTPGVWPPYYPSQVLVRLPAAVVLPAGHWWLVAYPTWSDGGSVLGWSPAAAVNGYLPKRCVPAATEWLYGRGDDLAFTLGGTPAIPRPLMQDALNGLLSSGITTMQRFYMSPVVAALRHSLSARYWLDDSHVKESSGYAVFYDDYMAVSALVGMAGRAVSNRAAIEDAIFCLVLAGEALAQQAIDDAKLHNGNPALISLAEGYVAQGLACAATDPAAAVRAYGAAWMNAVQAW